MYLGNQPGGLGKAERFIFTATGTTPTITHDTNGVPISYTPGQVSVYLNGVKQVVGTDVTATNGSTVVFAANLVVGDVVEVIALSTFTATEVDSSSIVSGAIDLAHMSVNSIDSDQYVDGSIDLAHMSSESVDEDNLQISNAGTNGQFLSKQSGNTGGLTWADAGGGGITHASQWRINAGFAGSAAPIGGSGLGGDGAWEEVDGPAGFGVIGASMTESDGIFTFPVTGYWLIDFKPRGRGNAGAARFYGEIYTKTGATDYETTGVGEAWLDSTAYDTAYTNYIFDVTSVSTHFVRFQVVQDNTSNTFVASDTNNYNSVSFIRLGDT